MKNNKVPVSFHNAGKGADAFFTTYRMHLRRAVWIEKNRVCGIMLRIISY